MKRVAFIGDQFSFGQNGIATFLRGIQWLADRENWMLDVIVPYSKRAEKYKNDFNIITTNARQCPRTNGKLNTFYRCTLSLRDSIEISYLLEDRLSEVLYDLLIFNHSHSVLVGYELDLFDNIPSIYYTHIPLKFAETSHEVADNTIKFIHSMFNHELGNSLVVGTQTQSNIDQNLYGSSAEVVRLPGDYGLYEAYINPIGGNKEGVLVIGRCDKRKNPKEFVRAIKESGLPAKVLAGSVSARKWRQMFIDAGITDFEIGEELYGEDKYKFIQSCKIAYIPSKDESFGYSAFEALHFMPTVLLGENKWSGIHKELGATIIPKEDVVGILKGLYNHEGFSNPLIDQYYMDMVGDWQKQVNREPKLFKNKISPPAKIDKYLKEHEGEWFSINHLLKEVLGRKGLAIIDIQAIAKLKKFYNIHHTKQETLVMYGEPSPYIEQHKEVGLGSFLG